MIRRPIIRRFLGADLMALAYLALGLFMAGQSAALLWLAGPVWQAAAACALALLLLALAAMIARGARPGS